MSNKSRVTPIESILSWFMLIAVIWTVRFLIPKAVRARELFGVICSALAALVALVAWLLIAAIAHSR